MVMAAPPTSAAVKIPPMAAGVKPRAARDGPSITERKPYAKVRRPKVANRSQPSLDSALAHPEDPPAIGSVPLAIDVHRRSMATREEGVDPMACRIESDRVGPRLGGDGLDAPQRLRREDLDHPGLADGHVHVAEGRVDEDDVGHAPEIHLRDYAPGLRLDRHQDLAVTRAEEPPGARI